MSDCLFDPPVFVKDGKYLIQEITSLSDAIDVLEDMPPDGHDVVHEAVLKACYEARNGLRPPEVAHKAFRQYAKRTGIFADPAEFLPIIRGSGNTRRKCDRGPVQQVAGKVDMPTHQ